MKESAFRTAVLSKLPASIHRQPMLAGMMGTAGTPDTYIDGSAGDGWIEWKVLPNADRLPATIPAKSMPTALQRQWLDRRFERGGNALVIVGVKLRSRAHGFVLSSPHEWTTPPLREWYEPRLLTAAELANYLKNRFDRS